MSIKSSSNRISDRGWIVIWVIALATATCAAYLPAMSAGWIWDDNYHVTNNIELLTPHGLRQIWLHLGAVPQYYPLTHTTFWIEFHLWGYHTLGYHLDNILLHTANALLVGLILRRLAAPGWWLAALIFALHPVQVESVAWVTERKNVLSGFLFLSALYIALDVWHVSSRTKAKSHLRYCLCLLLFVLALLSKTVTASFPAVILLIIWWKRRRITPREALSLLPFFLIGGAMGLLTAWMERHVVGAVGPDWHWTFPQRILIAGHAVWFYFAKLLWPHPLIFSYPKWTVSAGQSFYPLAVFALLFVAYRTSRAAFVATTFFLIVIFPALGFANTYPMRFSFVADHFQYLACIGPIAILAALIRRPIVGVPILILLAALTFRQAKTYANPEALWSYVVAKDPASLLGLSNLGTVLSNRGDLAGATDDMRKALQADPHFVEAQLGLGEIAEDRRDPAAAIRFYRAASADHPDNPLPYWYLGMWDRRYGDPSDALKQFARAAAIFPNPATCYEQMGEILLTQHNLPDAYAYFQRAVAANPDLIEAHNNLAAIYLQEPAGPDLAAAEQECLASLAVDPNNATACNDMAVVLGREGKVDQAMEYLQRALQRDTTSAIAHQNMQKLQP
jgi:protein O-mannosyl-transferase